jgi:hypothetical protein
VSGRFRFTLLACGLLAILTGCRDHRAGVDVPEVTPPELELCQRWTTLKNARDPKAEELLAPKPSAPEQPISPDEAERIQTTCFLHQDIRILSIRLTASNRLLLVAKGSVSAPKLEVRTTKGVDRGQRIMLDPDLIVEVRDGKIHGVRAQMHTE